MTKLTCELTIRELTLTARFIKCAVCEISKFYGILLYICITYAYKLFVTGYTLY